MKRQVPAARQTGAATLVMALGLMVAITSLVVAVARTRVTEQRLAGNEFAHLRQHQAAQSVLEYSIGWLARNAWLIDWPTENAGWQTLELTLPPRLEGLAGAGRHRLSAVIARQLRAPGYVRVSATAGSVQMEQYVRPLSLLSPEGEQAPPLVIDDCIPDLSGVTDIYPRNADGPDADAAVWSLLPAACHGKTGLDLHGGSIESGRFASGDLWDTLFSISRTEFQALAAAERGSDTAQRRYWWVTAADLGGPRWSHSLGTPDRPVALVFPAAVGCIPLAAGTRIYGILFYDGDCRDPGAGDIQGQVYGTLAVNGVLGRYSGHLRLAHISEAPDPRPALVFPTLRAPRLPGTWTDF